MLEGLFGVSLLLVAFAYFGYPLVIWLRARTHALPIAARDWEPSVDVLVVAHNAAAELAAKLATLAALDYPRERITIHIASDASTDDTVAIAEAAGVRVHAFAERRGKSACLGDVLPRLTAEIVVLTDVRQRLEPDAVRALVRPLADAAIGAVSGELMFERAESGHGGGVDMYWKYEKFIRRHEAISGSVVGVTGALYALRRALAPAVPPGLILDDLFIPLAVARTARVVFANDAIAWDRVSEDPAREAQRKRRTLAGNFQIIERDPALLLPWSHPLGWRIWGHKWLRLAVPWLLAVALVCNLALAGTSLFWTVLLAGQLALYALAIVGIVVPSTLGLLPVRIAATFVRMNGYAVLGLFDFVRDRDAHLWRVSAGANGAAR
ncbi:MAG TPA: glycosyltransferase [Rhodanobacteraceae bacterium]|nr:glycosyltransferase [Rhodanobacteraceae bacterium]